MFTERICVTCDTKRLPYSPVSLLYVTKIVEGSCVKGMLSSIEISMILMDGTGAWERHSGSGRSSFMIAVFLERRSDFSRVRERREGDVCTVTT